MSFQVCIKVVTPIGAPGVQTITGITDTDSVQFIGKQFFTFGYASLNSIDNANNSEFIDGYRATYGSDNLGSRQAGLAGSEVKAFNAKIVSGSSSGRTGGSFISNHSTILFGGATTLLGFISAASLGQFDITWTTNDGSTGSFLLIILGGDDLTLDTNIGDGTGSNPVITTANVPQAIIFQNSSNIPNPATGAGAFPIEFGWANIQPDASLGQGAISTHPINQAGNWRYQNINRCYSAITAPGGIPALSEDRSILAINSSPSSFQIDGSGSPGTAQWTSLGGIATSSGKLVEGDTIIHTNIVTRLIIFISTWKTSGSSIATDLASISIGVMDHSGRQLAYWSGENISGNGQNINGARTLRNDAGIIFATPAAAATAISSKAVFASMSDSAKTVGLSWTLNSGLSPDIFWLALGTTQVPPPPAPLSGIYKLVQGKTHDTLIDYIYSYYYYTTEDFAIPDPFIITALFGDE